MSADRVRELHPGLRARSQDEQVALLIAAAATRDELFEMDDIASALRPRTLHEEDPRGGGSFCPSCGSLETRNSRIDLYWHPVAALLWLTPRR